MLHSHAFGIALGSLGLGGVLLLFCRRRPARLAWHAGFVLLVIVTLPGCNKTNTTTPAPGNPGTTAGTYKVSLTSTARRIATTQSFSFTVQ